MFFTRECPLIKLKVASRYWKEGLDFTFRAVAEARLRETAKLFNRQAVVFLKCNSLLGTAQGKVGTCFILFYFILKGMGIEAKTTMMKMTPKTFIQSLLGVPTQLAAFPRPDCVAKCPTFRNI